jgi:hypothetical protein
VLRNPGGALGGTSECGPPLGEDDAGHLEYCCNICNGGL